MKKIVIGGLCLMMIIIIFSMNPFDSKRSKAIAAGEKLYHQNCSVCHGETGKGEGKNAGTAINNQHFLSSVSDRDLYHYVKFGREGTAMPAYGPRLSEKALHNLVAYIRDWQIEKINFEVPDTIAGDPERGREKYQLYCLSCHGEAGVGKTKMGTALSNPWFLKYTTDKQIWITTAYGREQTRMGPSLKGLDGARQLKKEDISDIVTYIRSIKGKVKTPDGYLKP